MLNDHIGIERRVALNGVRFPIQPELLLGQVLHQQAAQLRSVEVLELLEKVIGVLAGHGSIMPQEMGGSTDVSYLTDKQIRWMNEHLVDFQRAAAVVRAGLCMFMITRFDGLQPPNEKCNQSAFRLNCGPGHPDGVTRGAAD